MFYLYFDLSYICYCDWKALFEIGTNV